MRLLAFDAILFLSLLQESSALVINRAVTESLEPLLGVPPQVRQGDSAVFTIRHPPQAITKIALRLQSPDGAVSTPISSDVFTNFTDAAPSFTPTTRFCTPLAAFRSPQGQGGSRTQTVDQSGNWSVSLELTYHFGSNGYEYDPDDRVCISPPFKSEVANTEVLTMVVLPSSVGLATPPTTPSPSVADIQGTITGSPFLLTDGTTAPPSSASTTDITTGTSTSGAPSAKGWSKETGLTLAGITLCMMLF